MKHYPDLYLSFTDPKEARKLDALASLTVAACLSALERDATIFPADISGRTIKGIQFGNEFCERLLPHQRDLSHLIGWCRERQLTLTLSTPMLADKGIMQLTKLLSLLPDQCEVVCNDFGVLHLISEKFCRLRLIAGRQLCKMIKDPRLPSAEWTQAVAPNRQSILFKQMMKHFNISMLETEIRPFAEATDFEPKGLNLSVHFPFGYTLKGRICRSGSTHLTKQNKFTPGHRCQKECLTYFSKMERKSQQSSHELKTFMRGNTLFYRYSDTQEHVLAQALHNGWINRLILSGDWNENRRPY